MYRITGNKRWEYPDELRPRAAEEEQSTEQVDDEPVDEEQVSAEAHSEPVAEEEAKAPEPVEPEPVAEPVTEDHSHLQIISKRRLREMQTRIEHLEHENKSLKSQNQSLKSEIDSYFWSTTEIEAYERDIQSYDVFLEYQSQLNNGEIADRDQVVYYKASVLTLST